MCTWAQRNPKKVAEQGRRRYLKHKEKIKAKCREYYAKNKGKVKEYQRTRRENDLGYSLFCHARERARKRGLPFGLQREDVVVPEKCSLLGIPLFLGDKTLCDNSPTLDRIVAEKGYVRGNIQVISYKANRMKNNSTFKEFELMYQNWKKQKGRVRDGRQSKKNNNGEVGGDTV